MSPPSWPHAASMSLRQRGYLALAFNACFFIVIGWWLYNNVRYADLLTQLQRIPPRAIFLAMAMNLVVLTLYGRRVATIVHAKPMACFLVTTVGFTFNALIPFRIGEGIKIYVGGRYFDMPLGSLAAAVVMEKFYDLTAVIALATLLGLASESQFVQHGRSTIVALALVVAVFAAAVVRLRLTGATPRLPEWKLLRSLRLDAILRQAESVLTSHDVFRVALLTGMIWTINASLVFFLFSTLLSGFAFGVLDAIALVVIGALAIAVPASPAGLGVFEAGLVSYLTTMHNVPTELAISSALAYHFCLAAPHTIVALLFLGVQLARTLKAKTTA